MNKPYIICYMMMSIDGRIDCAMTSQLSGVEEYYPLLDQLGLQSSLSGRVTAELEMAEPGKFTAEISETVSKETVSQKADCLNGCDVIADTKGTLLWKHDSQYARPHIILTSEQVSRAYLNYLDKQNISYIAAGKQGIDLMRAMEILKGVFGVERLGVVGGPTINTAFLDAGLLDEVIVLIGAGIDGRAAFPQVFNRKVPLGDEPIRLKLAEVKSYDSGAVMIRYRTK